MQPLHFILSVIILISLVALLKCYTKGARNTYQPDISDKVIVITGSNAGIGFGTALELALMSPKTIIMACRSQARALAAIATIQQQLSPQNKTKLEFVKLDLSDLKSIKQFSDEMKKKYQKIDILINNAGMMIQDLEFTPQNYEMTFSVNYLGHFYLTSLLLEQIKASPEGRIINVSSIIHKIGELDLDNLNYEKGTKYLGFQAYAKAKLCSILFTKQLDLVLKKQGVSNVKTASLHPGIVNSDFIGKLCIERPWFRFVFCAICGPPFLFASKFCFKTESEGAQSSLLCCLIDFKKLESGGYYKDCIPIKADIKQNWEEDGKKLWQKSEEMIQKKIQ